MDSKNLLKFGIQQVLSEQEKELLRLDGNLSNYTKFTRQFDELKGSEKDADRLRELNDLIQL